MNVLNHFNQAFGGYEFPNAMDASDMAGIPLGSPCGEDCKKAIDAAASFAELYRQAHGSWSSNRAGTLRELASMTAALCLTYICG